MVAVARLTVPAKSKSALTGQLIKSPMTLHSLSVVFPSCCSILGSDDLCPAIVLASILVYHNPQKRLGKLAFVRVDQIFLPFVSLADWSFPVSTCQRICLDLKDMPQYTRECAIHVSEFGCDVGRNAVDDPRYCD